ncbi:hypothetical protein DFP74_1055 [Nocardiopsis sp. Huas11]|uniref:hypothetical protein n=1 Tax=Nocardiopsis sp. Huas11 TaxID=2183912 RepID=UPI000F125406|nr:hypothetical protein [Nocardiopsis sp. Huas11]RKS05456.1 hypothetical protein DFP74_1055 [Nocardiopsis sp. Huas11]
MHPFPPPQPSRHGTGLLVVLTVIAILGGAAFLGGSLALTEAAVGLVGAGPDEGVAERPSERESPDPRPSSSTAEPTRPPTAEPTPEPTPEPDPSPSGPAGAMTAADLVDALREEHAIGSRLDTTEEFCVESEESAEPDPFLCTSAMDTDAVRIVAFENAGIAMAAALAMRDAQSGSDAQDTQDACHFVLVWFEHHGLDQGERDGMAADARSAAGC